MLIEETNLHCGLELVHVDVNPQVQILIHKKEHVPIGFIAENASTFDAVLVHCVYVLKTEDCLHLHKINSATIDSLERLVLHMVLINYQNKQHVNFCLSTNKKIHMTANAKTNCNELGYTIKASKDQLHLLYSLYLALFVLIVALVSAIEHIFHCLNVSRS